MHINSGISDSLIPINLHQLVDHAAGISIPKAVERNSFIVNEVSREVEISSNEKILATILDKMLSTLVSHSKHSCIRIKATVYGDIVCLSIKDKSNFSDNTVTEYLDPVKDLAKKLRGSIIVRNIADKFTTILLSFPNLPIAE